MINSNSLYMNLHQTKINDIIRDYNTLQFLNTTRTVIVIEPTDIQDKILELCIKSIFYQEYRINNLYVITRVNNIPDYINNTSVVVNSFEDVKLLEPEQTTHIVRLNNIDILDSEEFIRLCKVNE